MGFCRIVAAAVPARLAGGRRHRGVHDLGPIALGLANLGSGVHGGLACGGSLSQSAVNDGAGARTELSPIIAAALSLVTVVALTPCSPTCPRRCSPL